MKPLKIGDIEAKIPIVQGGMGVCISLSGLASAVANEGGVGIISAVGIGLTEPDYIKNYREANKRALKKEIRKAKSKTDGILGVNLMLAITDFDDLFKVAIEEEIDIIIIGAGLLLNRPKNVSAELFESTKTKFIPKVSSARATRIIINSWLNKFGRIPDGFVLEGPLAGGHLGFANKELNHPDNKLEKLLNDTLNVLNDFEQKTGEKIPLIAGGGIYTGKDIYKTLEMGASAVKMGTRFVTTHECDASIEFKNNYINCKEEDITIIDSPVGLPGRVILNDFVKSINNGYTKPVKCPWKCLKTCNYKEVKYCIAQALFNAAQGKLDEGFSFAGSNAWQAKRIQYVKDVFKELIQEYEYNKFAVEKIDLV